MSGIYKEEDEEHEIKPGAISPQLRQALGIGKDELPVWIYRMRALGYPPGWLRKAVIDEVNIFDTDVESVPTEKQSSAVQYDYSKFIPYPGFNTPLPENSVDYHYYFNMPAMLPHQQLDYAKSIFSQQTQQENDKSINRDEKNSPKITMNDKNEIKTKREEPPECISPDIDESPSPNISLNRTASNTSIKLISKGSPMPTAGRKPSLDKFSEGMSELLYFQNLPTSTGVFKGMQGVISTIRSRKSNGDTTKSDSTNE